MTTLAQLQRDYKRYLLAGDDRIVDSIVDTAQLSARDRLEIYANAYRGRLREALSVEYPVTKEVVGDSPFIDVLDAYIDANPSTSFTLRGFGAKLGAFVESNTDLRDRAFIAELAAFEWALADAFDARDAGVATVAELAAIPPETWPTLELLPHPSVRLVDLRFDTLDLWNAVRAGRPPPAPRRLTAAGACLVWRQELATVFRAIEPAERDAWDVLAAGGPFAAICEALLETSMPADVPLHAATMLKNWLDAGLIEALRPA